MKFIGNICWLLLGGILVALMYWLAGLIMCITIIGIPFGVQLFKFGTFSFGRLDMNCAIRQAKRVAYPRL